MLRHPALCILIACSLQGSAQYNWQLKKEKEGIRVYLSEVAGSPFKAIRVEARFAGTFDKLIRVLNRVEGYTGWIYKNKLSKLVKQYGTNDFAYYSQTNMPVPLSNRDVVIRIRIHTDSLPNVLRIQGNSEKSLVPEIPGLVRVPYQKARWRVTMPAENTLHVVYTLEIDPGGSIPAWLVNSFADKGPYNTFKSLAEELKN